MKSTDERMVAAVASMQWRNVPLAELATALCKLIDEPLEHAV